MRGIRVARYVACVLACVFGVVAVDGGAASPPDEQLSQTSPAGGEAKIDGGQRFVFVGKTVCICGYFPTAESRRGLMIGGIAAGEPVSESSTMVEIRVPDGIAPGTYEVSASPSAGFEAGTMTEIVVLGLGGSIDRDLLRSGQATPMRIVITGTEEPLELRLINETTQIISIEGGDDGVVTTSGGGDNTVERTVRGLRPGDFNITYSVADDPCPCATGPDTSGSEGGRANRPPVRTGYPLPDGVTVVEDPVGTGRTTGHIAEITLANHGPDPIVFPDRPIYIPSDDGYQDYVVPGGRGTTVPAGATRTIPIDGYCGDVRKPPVPAGAPVPGLDDWVVPIDSTTSGPVPPSLIPAGVIDPLLDPEIAAPYLWGAAEAIEDAVDQLQESGEMQTPFSGNRDRERESVVQQTLWRYSGELTGEPYTREEFGDRLQEQYEEATGTPIASATEQDRERLERGADDFWDAFELVGEQAKVLQSDETVPVSDPESSTSEEVVEPPCDIDRSMEHSEIDSEFKMSESYKDEAKRDNLEEWFEDLPEFAEDVEGGTFERSRKPASSWAVAGRDFIGGYTNAVAKHVYLEARGGTDWVWSTELIEVDAESNGTHTMTVTPPPGGDCETLVVGAGGGVVEAWSNAIDPIANTRHILEVLRVVRDVSIIVASVALAPVTAGGSLALGIGTMVATKAFDGEFNSDANAAVAVEGRMLVQVKRRRIQLDANSRSTLGGDGTVESDAAKLSSGETSDIDPLTLTVTTNGLTALKSRASDNGIAEGTVESQIGLAIVAFCRCGDGVQIEYLTDSGLFLVEEGAAGAATRTANRLEEMLGDVLEPYLGLPAEQVIPKARADLPTDLEEMVRNWYLENGSDSGGFGYFGVTREGAGGN